MALEVCLPFLYFQHSSTEELHKSQLTSTKMNLKFKRQKEIFLSEFLFSLGITPEAGTPGGTLPYDTSHLLLFLDEDVCPLCPGVYRPYR